MIKAHINFTRLDREDAETTVDPPVKVFIAPLFDMLHKPWKRYIWRGYVNVFWCWGGANNLKLITGHLCNDVYKDNLKVVFLASTVEELGDALAVIDLERDYHDFGTLIKELVNKSVTLSSDKFVIDVTFSSKTTTSIRGIVIGLASNDSKHLHSSAYDYCPACKGDCDPDYYTSVIVPLLGIDVDLSVEADATYRLVIELVSST